MMTTNFKEVLSDVEEISGIADTTYQSLVGNYFEEVKELSERFQSNNQPVTDTELESILTLLPLKLFSISEALSKAKLTNEIVKIKTKAQEGENEIDYKLAAAVYSSVITRIEKEASYCRELIMSSKKIWDSRRSAEEMPIRTDVSSNHSELPDYDAKTYIG